MLYMYTTKDLLQSYELSIVLNEWQMFDDIKLRKCWQQLKSITKANVFRSVCYTQYFNYNMNDAPAISFTFFTCICQNIHFNHVN